MPRTGTYRFIAAVAGDWDTAMDQFFTACDRKRIEQDHTVEQVYRALQYGYGDEVAEEWITWNEEV